MKVYVTMKKHYTLHQFLSDKTNHFVALGIFLLITFSIPFGEGFFNQTIGMLTAGISYFILLDLTFMKTTNMENAI
jgi:hypothetical protein|tara:strand:+ start:8802 stop:9029 length:228 start_codon:yes stop_codon:yes gene_type:complete